MSCCVLFTTIEKVQVSSPRVLFTLNPLHPVPHDTFIPRRRAPATCHLGVPATLQAACTSLPSPEGAEVAGQTAE